MDLDKELSRVSNWLVIQICHERYSFGTNVSTYNACTLKEVFEDLMIPRTELEKYLEKPREKYFPDEHNYNYDRTVRNKLDTKYSFPYLAELPLRDIYLDATHIIDMEYLDRKGSAGFIWGSTDKKFGLIDIDRDAVAAKEENGYGK